MSETTARHCGQVWLCHPDDLDKPDCYADWQRPPIDITELFRELRGETP
jgi:hypothetical protein